jgi:4-diphosphocytidyl-2-C-methyl-D-erythritol kinase
VTSIAVFSPAKLNLSLAVTGRRSDGFHDLVSVVAPLDWGDTLEVEPAETGVLELRTDCAELAVDDSNLVIRAAKRFQARSGWRGGARIRLHKRIPLGAGLGGGSSNAVATLRALNQLAGDPLGEEAMLAVATELGSDCPLFLHRGPVVMRGRGERVEPVPPAAAARMQGQRVLIFKPAFSVSTAWAYQELARQDPPLYLAPEQAEARLDRWLRDPRAPWDDLLFNSLEAAVFPKFVALPTLLARLHQQFGWTGRMSGSGSACFLLVPAEGAVEPVIEEIKTAWGATAFTTIAGIAT